MRKALLFFSVCSLMFAACSGDDSEAINNDSGGDTITLPIEFDFTGVAVPNNATSIELNGIEVRAGNTYSHVTGWADCAEPNNAVLENVIFNDEESSIGLGTANYNTLIADVSSLPAIHKITINMASYGLTRISLCGGNEVIAENNIGESQIGLTTVILNVGGHTAERLYIGCLEGGLYSIRIE